MLPSTPRSSKWSFSIRCQNQDSVCTSILPHTRPPHPSSYGHPNNIGEEYKLWNQTPYAMFSSRLLLLPSETKHPPQHPTLDTLIFWPSINVKTNFHINTKQHYFRCHTESRDVPTRSLSLCLFPRHDASSGWGWKRRPTGMDGGCEYIEQAAGDSRKGAYSSLGIRRRARNVSQ